MKDKSYKRLLFVQQHGHTSAKEIAAEFHITYSSAIKFARRMAKENCLKEIKEHGRAVFLISDKVQM